MQHTHSRRPPRFRRTRVFHQAAPWLLFTALTGCDLFTPLDDCMNQVCGVPSADASPSASVVLPSASAEARDSAPGSTAPSQSVSPLPVASSAASVQSDSGPPDSGITDSASEAGVDCTAECGGDTPYCDVTTGQCAVCLLVGGTAVTLDASTSALDIGCTADAPHCVAQTGTPNAERACAECVSDTDCNNGVCDPSSLKCTPCLPSDGPTDPGCGAAVPRCYVSSTNDPSADAGGGDTEGSDALGDAVGDAGSGESSDGQCVVCLSNLDCGGDAPWCDTNAHACVGCLTSEDCSDPGAAKCDSVTRSCTACLPEEHDTLTGRNADCQHLGGSDICEAGTCVQCTGEWNTCNPTVCNEAPGAERHTCSGALLASAHACTACVSDAQCQPGQACVMTTFGSGEDKQEVGYFCLYRVVTTLTGSDQEIVANRDQDGVKSCTIQAQPYVTKFGDSTPVVSLSGANGAYCAPRAATCLAFSQYSETPCSPPQVTPDSGGGDPQAVSECGEPGVEDAVCQDWDGLWRCSPRCTTDEDCVIGGTDYACVEASGSPYRYCGFNPL